MKVGISTSILNNKHRLSDFDNLNIDLIEFYNYRTSFLNEIEDYCGKNELGIALHVPIPFDGTIKKFSPSGPNLNELDSSLEMTLQTVEYGKKIGAEHIVVHYPSPYPANQFFIEDSIIDRFLKPIEETVKTSGINVLIENLSASACIYLPNHYLDVLNRYPELNFCLDFGHAHILNPVTSIDEFITIIGSKIMSSHIYNTTLLRYGKYGHEYPIYGENYDNAINITKEVLKLRSVNENIKLILEVDERYQFPINQLKKNIDYIRAIK
jgi:sugar phosphate isomerase/epimerase